MTDLKKMKYAKSYIDQMANGINPVTGMNVNENTFKVCQSQYN